MSNLNHIDAMLRFNDAVLQGKSLPEFVFGRRFDGYRFFDADMCTNSEFLDALQRIIKESLGQKADCHVFSCSSPEYLCDLGMDENWAALISVLNKKIRSDGDCGGLMLLADSGTWIVYQPQPIDIGVFAFSSANDFDQNRPDFSDCFFNCSDVENWLVGDTDRDLALRESFGAEFLGRLLQSYCCE